MWKVHMLISTPLRNVRIIAPPIHIMVPNTLVFPAAVSKFNLSKLNKLNQNIQNKLISYKLNH